MDQIRLAILSDLHIGRGARAKDMCPHLDGPDFDDNYREKFVQFLRAKSISADYLILPGDITHTAHPDEVQLASDVVTEVAASLQVPHDRLIFVPGNHDVDWKVLQLGDNALRRKQRYDPLKQEGQLFSTLLQSSGGALLDAPYLTKWELPNLFVVGFNSSWHDDESAAIHYGRIDPEHIDHLEALLGTIPYESDVLRLFLVHHHPVQYDSPGDHRDFSQMVNSERLIRVLLANRFDLLIHGHTHQPRFHTHASDTACHLAILASGSFSIDLPKQWMGRINNQFHLMTIEGRQSDGHINGSIASWTYYCPHGWIESDAVRDGIAFQEPFGVYWTPQSLQGKLKTYLSAAFDQTQFIDLQSLIDGVPELRYVRPEVTLQSLEAVSDACGFRIHNRSFPKLVLLREAK